MLVFALQFSRCARHDVEAKASCTRRYGRPVPATRRSSGAVLMLGVEGNSLKTEEKTRSVERNMVKR